MLILKVEQIIDLFVELVEVLYLELEGQNPQIMKDPLMEVPFIKMSKLLI